MNQNPSAYDQVKAIQVRNYMTYRVSELHGGAYVHGRGEDPTEFFDSMFNRGPVKLADWLRIPAECVITFDNFMLDIYNVDHIQELKKLKMHFGENLRFVGCSQVYFSTEPETYHKWCWCGSMNDEYLAGEELILDPIKMNVAKALKVIRDGVNWTVKAIEYGVEIERRDDCVKNDFRPKFGSITGYFDKNYLHPWRNLPEIKIVFWGFKLSGDPQEIEVLKWICVNNNVVFIDCKMSNGDELSHKTLRS